MMKPRHPALNMQQIPKQEQDLYLKLVNAMGKGYIPSVKAMRCLLRLK